MRLEALWHDLECGDYERGSAAVAALAGEAGGPVLDVGAGTGRVSSTSPPAACAVVALDTEPALLEALRTAPRGLPVETVVADARDFTLARRFALVLVPMQTLQLLGGRSGRAAFLRCALEHLEPGGLVAAALADAMDCFDDEHDAPPPPDAREVAGVRYASQLVSVVDDGGRAAIHRRREIIGPQERREWPRRRAARPGHGRGGRGGGRRTGLRDRALSRHPRDRGVPRLDGGRPPRAALTGLRCASPARPRRR